MGSRPRGIVAEGLAQIIQALPDQAIITLNIENLPRDKFDILRGDVEAIWLPRSEIWMATVPFPAGVTLEIETRESPGLRAVS